MGYFWGAINHQGDFYDSTVATIPFLIRMAACEEVPCRDSILGYLYTRYLDAPDYGGDPLVPDPPGGIDIPTPMVDRNERLPADDDTDEEPDWDEIRRMDLCAWQAGQAIQPGRPIYETLLAEPGPIGGAAANLLLLWHETRDKAKAELRTEIDAEAEPIQKAMLLLQYGVYGNGCDTPASQYWVSPRAVCGEDERLHRARICRCPRAAPAFA